MVEARTLARFDHPNIVKVSSVFEANNTAYMVMRYEQGMSLGAIFNKRKTLPERLLQHLVHPILDGLEEVHNGGFVHRDIKPDNIYLRQDGSPVLLDFGSARVTVGAETRAMTSLVSPGFAPFEQYVTGSDKQGPWSDIYSLGQHSIAGSAAFSRRTQRIAVRRSAIPVTTGLSPHSKSDADDTRNLFCGPWTLRCVFATTSDRKRLPNGARCSRPKNARVASVALLREKSHRLRLPCPSLR